MAVKKEISVALNLSIITPYVHAVVMVWDVLYSETVFYLV